MANSAEETEPLKAEILSDKKVIFIFLKKQPTRLTVIRESVFFFAHEL